MGREEEQDQHELRQIEQSFEVSRAETINLYNC